MQKIISVYKPVGLTPLQVIKKLRIKMPELTKEKIGYAGRLDPLAHGVMLLMVGDETKNRDKYLNLSKIYEFELLFGLQTDTYDLLGYLKEIKLKPVPSNVKLIVNTFVNSHTGKQMQSYPPYSSKPVMGKPLFWWARNNKLDEIEIPKREIDIYEFSCLSTGEIAQEELKQQVKQALSSVHGDFRQESILKRWKDFFLLKTNQNRKFISARFRIHCSSGTYVRELVNLLGKEIGCGAVTLDILRTKVGDFTIKEALLL